LRAISSDVDARAQDKDNEIVARERAPMEATMNFARIFAVVVTLGVLSTASSQETPKQDSAPTANPPAGAPASGSQAPGGAASSAQTPSSGAAQPATGSQAPASTASPPPPPSAAVGKTGVIKDNEFIPTEEIQPDEAVTFPVDI
jgi:hypothetical protein